VAVGLGPAALDRVELVAEPLPARELLGVRHPVALANGPERVRAVTDRLRRFRAETAKHIRDYMAIVLDQRVMGRPPVIQSAIGTRGQITMGQGRSLQDAQVLALVLRAGALPVPLKVSEVRNIGASLGSDSIRNGIRALVIAMGLVVLILIVYYRFSGVLAVVALGLYVLYTMAMLAYFNAVLTLPGLAGYRIGNSRHLRRHARGRSGDRAAGKLP
jgi:protein-export membrane protein SecD